jgi:hypothetical protein
MTTKSKSLFIQEMRGKLRGVSKEERVELVIKKIEESGMVTLRDEHERSSLRWILEDNKGIFPYNTENYIRRHKLEALTSNRRDKSLATKLYDTLLSISEDLTGGLPTDEVAIHVYHSRSSKRSSGTVYRDIGPKSLELIEKYLKSRNLM